MRSEVGEWLATCVGSPICILLLSWSLLIYQNQPSTSKRRIDVLVVAVLSESLAHQLGLLLYAILTLIKPVNHFGELCSTLVWILNTSSVLQELTLTTIAIFSVIEKNNINFTKNHLKYHLVSLSVISACIGVTGVLNFEPDICVFLAHEISVKYGIFLNSLRALLILTSVLGLLVSILRNVFHKPKGELLKSVSDLSETSSKNSSGAFECHPHNWDPSNISCTSGSTNSRACLRKQKIHVDECTGSSTVYSILFVCYVFNHLPVLVVSVKPDLLRGFCSTQNLATWLPLLQDALLPVFLAIFDRMFCRYVARVYTKQDHARKLSHAGVDGKFRHFEQDAEYKLQLNLNHGLKFPLTNGSLYGRLHNHQNRGRTGTITMGVQHYPRSQSVNEESAYASLPAELTSFTSSTFEPRQEPTKMTSEQQQQIPRIRINDNFEFGTKRKIGSTDVFGQNMENLVQLEEPDRRNFARSLEEIREESIGNRMRNVLLDLEHLNDLENSDIKERFESCRGHNEDFMRGSTSEKRILHRNQSLDHGRYPKDSRTFVKRDLTRNRDQIQEQECGYETSDDESCCTDNPDYDDTISSCRSRSRSCCSVTTVANDDFEYYQRKETKI
ncbi:uncharacterized protein LOC107268951 isoform X2 [Cephus cinctus]|nr:uncharacterized protein LOC107268951 isoform X2 [Cephus cinctus]